MSNPIRFGIVGAGMIASNSAKGIQKHESAQLLAATDLSEERLKALTGTCNIPRSYPTAEALFADPEIDAVYIAVPNKFHAPLATQALKAGKHVILDKPFALSHAEALSVAAAAADSGKVFTLGMNFRFQAVSQQLHALVKQGYFGEVYHAKTCWFRRSGIPKLGTWFGNKAMAGGGAIYDIGVHFLDLCLYIIDNFEPVAVTGVTYTKFGNRGLGEGSWGLSEREGSVFDVDDFASAFIRMKNGATITLDVTWACHAPESSHNNVQIFGTEAGATLNPPRIYKGGGSAAEFEVITELPATPSMPHGDRFHNFINHLLGVEELCVTTDQALTVQRILDAVAESAALGREVRLDLDPIHDKVSNLETSASPSTL